MNIDFPNNGDTFSGFDDALKWCKDNGYSVGSMCSSQPIGIIKGNVHIAKWKNLSSSDIMQLDGIIDGDYRNGTVTITVYEGRKND